MKKILSVILACAMLCGMSTIAYANEGTELISSDMDLDALPVIEEIGYYEMVDAEFVSFDADKFEVTLKDDAGEYVGILSMNTIIFDDNANVVISAGDLKVGDKLKVYRSTMMTRSLPPMVNVFAIISNVEDGSNTYVVIPEKGIVPGGEYVLTAPITGDKITISDETAIHHAYMKCIVTFEDIDAYDTVVYKADVITASIPALINATEMWISDSSADFVIPEIESIVGEEGVKEIDGVIYVPVRKVAEEKGYIVEWIGETKSVIVSKGVESFNMTIDSDIYGYNKAIVKYEKPLLIDSTTYVPLSFITDIF